MIGREGATESCLGAAEWAHWVRATRVDVLVCTTHARPAEIDANMHEREWRHLGIPCD